jgi:hypothetical protein
MRAISSDGTWSAKPVLIICSVDYHVLKVEDQRLVFGWANVSASVDGQLVVDSHSDTIAPATLEKAAYEYVLNFRDTGQMHAGGSVGRLVESFMVTPDKLAAMGLAKDALPVGLWVGFKIDDADVWAKVKSGEYPMFSIQGKAKRIPV